ncbi:hypothetical protein C8Q70DRAFT_62022 [Cubamyces menziesii]|nr:hypothetical protein C8Q70DRAFT_62022 [Cubamyces menziesii]
MGILVGGRMALPVILVFLHHGRPQRAPTCRIIAFQMLSEPASPLPRLARGLYIVARERGGYTPPPRSPLCFLRVRTVGPPLRFRWRLQCANGTCYLGLLCLRAELRAHSANEALVAF